jgi:hypothetical protein
VGRIAPFFSGDNWMRQASLLRQARTGDRRPLGSVQRRIGAALALGLFAVVIAACEQNRGATDPSNQQLQPGQPGYGQQPPPGYGQPGYGQQPPPG